MKRKSYKVSDNQLSIFGENNPSMPILDKSRCKIKEINYQTGSRIIETYHYAHRVPSMSVLIGMFVDDILAGVISYSKTLNNISASICGEEYTDNVLELSRLFIFDWAGRNSESYFIGQSFNFIPNNICILLSYSDKKQNHLGTIYQATNWLYTRISKPSNGREYMLSDGTILTRQCRHFTKNKDGQTMLSWNKIKELYPGIQKYKSSEKHRYVYFLGDKRKRKELKQQLKWPVLPYPKL